jgi:hypothetical protein
MRLNKRQKPGISPANEAGFSTIEVIAALAIFVTALLPLMQTQLDIQRLSQRIQQNAIETTALTQSMRYLRNVNPAQHSDGEWVFSEGRLSWQARPIGPDTGFVKAQGLRYYMVGYYDMDIRIELQNGTVLSEKMRSVGWRHLDESEINRRGTPL